MKKVIFTVAAVFAFGFANAQDTAGPDTTMSFGVKGGLNVASISNSDDAKSLIGFHVGAFGEFMLSEKFAIQPEVLFSTQGAKIDNSLGETDYKLNYINIPVMAKFYVTPAVSVELGPQIGFLMSADFGDDDVKDDLNSTDFGIGFGVGYNLTSNMSLNARYTIGLSDIEKEPFPGEDASQNGVLQVSFGYKF
ncbi:porin family protein [Flavobacterium sp. GT3R68]|uniref:porin family protein n=1 Tax=Flavobacterium sp. GT3R68 TaxID=2594437 RepID=UPI000F864B16|nr:porin family protein [Flavobacterium sp. GT3R68]RTY89662.1 PorT family protein [Flavobacterium sp. GSN2]TRW89452.1 PorT family protein [Flavobacterium sp. GT3R68]